MSSRGASFQSGDKSSYHRNLSPQSPDEQISRDVLLNRLPELPPPSLIVIVVDASNLQRNLYYATQVIELGHPTRRAWRRISLATMWMFQPPAPLIPWHTDTAIE